MSSANSASTGQDSETGPAPSCWIKNDSLSILHSVAVHPVLPVDVLEEVINEAGDDTACLRHLSLTCSAFLPRARYHLFSGIVIQTEQQLENSGEFLDSRPWLPPLIQKVVLRVVFQDNSNEYWRLLDVVPVHLFSRLPNLRVWRMESEWTGHYYGGPKVWLSLHRSTLSCYRRCSVGIQVLELPSMTFNSLLDFKRLVSAFTALRTLSCSIVQFRTEKDHDSFLPVPKTNTLQVAQTLRILRIGEYIDRDAIKYLLASGASTVNSLTMTINSDSDPEDDDYIRPLASWTSGLSELSSLTLVVQGSWARIQLDTLKAIRYATRIIEDVRGASLRTLSEVRVEFKLDAIATLGYWFSKDNFAPLGACRALEEVLLGFETPGRVLFSRPFQYPRAGGRTGIWSPLIKNAFPKLSNLGLLTFMGNIADPLGHEEAITSLVFSHNSKLIATASKDGTIIIWDAEHGTIVHEWVAHHGRKVYDIAFSPNSQRLVSAGDGTSGTFAVWDISDGVHKAAAPEGHTEDVATCAWSPNGALVASASKDGTVRLFDAHTFQQRELLKYRAAGDPYTRYLQFSPDGSYLAWMRCSDGRCTIWRPLAEEQPKMLPSRYGRGQMNAFSFDPQSRKIATAHGHRWGEEPEHCVVRIWDAATGTELAVLAGHSRCVFDVSFSPDGKLLLSASDDGSAKIWDADSWVEIASLEPEEGGDSGILKACFSPDGKHIATASSKGTVRVWRTGDASCAAVFTEHTTDIWRVAFSPDGKFLASGDEHGIVYIHRASDLVGL